MNSHDIHLVQEINQDPSLLMELLSLAFRADDGYDEEQPKDDSDKEFRIVLAQLAYNFIFN